MAIKSLPSSCEACSIALEEQPNLSDEIATGEFANFWKRLPGVLKALAVGIPAGYVFDLLDTPIPWMIGPMVAVAALNLMGVHMHSPPYARHLGQVILGSAVSLYFTSTVVAALAGTSRRSLLPR